MKFDITHYPCSACGAFMAFSPKLGTLACEYCGNEEKLSVSNQKALHAYDYFSKITTLQEIDHGELNKELSCPKCAGEFSFETLQFAHHCPYCETPAVIDRIQSIKPQGVIPFAISRQEAKKRFEEWIASRWFAPNSLSEHFNNTKEMIGHYLPFWTFDAQTTTKYRGYRGEYIDEDESQSDGTTSYSVGESSYANDGSFVENEVGSRPTRWYRVNGEVQRSFSNLAISANKDGIEHINTHSVAPWDVKSAVDFDTKYISGFEAKEYHQTLPHAYKSAQSSMESSIKWDIERQIGGDDQRIEECNIEYKEVKYKNLLFPLWVAQLDWKGKHYEYAINGLTGKVSGQRPYSVIKIAFAFVVVVIIIGGVWYSMSR
ncbi:MAG: hypothetical protein U9N49_12550 [Campylobacterota bacterium]|nr:hypothetical protein [Campylobacterota bacterium]